MKMKSMLVQHLGKYFAGETKYGEQGQTLVEYGLILFLISITIIVVLSQLGFPHLYSVLEYIRDTLAGAE